MARFNASRMRLSFNGAIGTSMRMANGFRIRIGEIGLRVGRILHRDTRHDIGFAGRNHRGGNRHIGAENVGRLLDLGLLAPVVVIARQDDVLSGIPFAEDVGPGADRLADERRSGRCRTER